MKKVMLIIRDGWGYSDKQEGNAIAQADTPYDDWLNEQPAQVLLACHGPDVGLPEGFQGSSEVGHLNMGAGRIVVQEVTRIFESIRDESIFEFPSFQSIETLLEDGGGALHFVGLLQDEGVHAHQEHLFQLYRKLRDRFPETQVWVHPIADGRDTPPKSFPGFFKQLMDVIGSDPHAGIGSVWGRYYGMDRSRNWKLIEVARDAMISGRGRKTDDIIQAVRDAYASEKTPDNEPMFDEYLKPIIHSDYPGIEAGDVVINFNYRQDRAIQISQAFTEPDCPAYTPECESVHYFGLTRYYNTFSNYLMPPMDDAGAMSNILGEVISEAGFTQLRIAETQKFRHVTSFFNGKSTDPFPGEDQVEVPSEWDPSSFASHPEMNAADVTEELLKRLASGKYGFIAVNYANCDMVGHTGILEAARKGAEAVDRNVERVAGEALRAGYSVIITADHGNSEEMVDGSGEPKTSHTVNPVKMFLL
ncbi:MAG TPA: 2,3-bisphosphoglycerate-independent phosphoglycerate mutase, partial [bacterium]|nr:2,3-bisphosphoglycerate-independent phosphoglycerate mutase [bacterium]